MGETTWAQLRPGNDHPLVISFDWDDDHSSWRIEDLAEQIAQACDLLSRHGIAANTVTTTGDLLLLAEQLRDFDSSRAAHGAENEELQRLLPQLDFDEWALSYDSDHDYEFALEWLYEALRAWYDHHPVVVSPDGEIVSVFDQQYLCEQRRDGLGLRWSVTLTDGVATLADGTELNGYPLHGDARYAVEEVADRLRYNNDSTPWVNAFAETLTALGAQARLAQYNELLELVLGHHVDGGVFLDTLTTVQTLTAEQLDRVAGTVRTLSESWNGLSSELLAASLALSDLGSAVPERSHNSCS